jgi:hypothetical protein
MAKRSRRLKRPRKRKSERLRALLGAAAMLGGLGLGAGPAHAQSAADNAEVRFGFLHYRDRQFGESRMRIREPEVWFKSPLGDYNEVEGAFTYDSMSGASPFYLSTLSGASGIGVNDIRRAEDGRFTHYFERFSIGVGVAHSKEDDYRSSALSLDTHVWGEDKNTVLEIGIGGNRDHITSTNNPALDEARRSREALIGVTQILDDQSMLQSNLTYRSGDGYFTDPYKTFDVRPESRHEVAWLTRYVRYLGASDGSLHLDYRLTHDTWGIGSHMLEASWYQPVSEHWMLRPSMRYYMQNAADFFGSAIPPPNIGETFSADQRLADFGEISVGLKVIRELGAGFAIDAKCEVLQQRASFKLGGHDSTGIEPLSAMILAFGVTKKF